MDWLTFTAICVVCLTAIICVALWSSTKVKPRR